MFDWVGGEGGGRSKGSVGGRVVVVVQFVILQGFVFKFIFWMRHSLALPVFCSWKRCARKVPQKWSN